MEQNLRQKDEFYKETYRFFDAMAKHRQLVAVGAVVLVAACIAGGFIANRRAARAEEAKNVLYLAEKAYDKEMKAVAGVKEPSLDLLEDSEDEAEGKDASSGKPADKAKADEKAKAKKAKDELRKAMREEQAASSKKLEELAFTKLDVDAKFPEAIKKYGDVIAKYDGTRAALEARLSLGTLYYNHGQWAKAATHFQAAAATASGAQDRATAHQSWGYALENDGKHAEALSAYEKALNYSEGSIKGDVWLGIARSHEAMHDSAKARSTYDQIITQLPNSDASRTAEALKARLQ